MSDAAAGRCPFNKRYVDAHAEAGLARVPLAPLLRRLREDPGLLDPATPFDLGRLGVDLTGLSQRNREELHVNLLLALLFEDLADYVRPRLLEHPKSFTEGPFEGRMPRRGRFGAEELRQAYLADLRDASLAMVNSFIGYWQRGLAQQDFILNAARQPPNLLTAAWRQLYALMDGSEYYRKAGYDITTIAVTGSNTALHICWSLVEVAPLLAPGSDAAGYEALVRRSRKEVLPLAIGSLGMLVTYMEASGLHPPSSLAVHPMPADQTAFRLESEAGGPVMRLQGAAVEPFRREGDGAYTGCPAFYVPGFIESYLDWVIAIAAHYGVYPVEVG
ncbi:MAG TPA: hypothetical protein VEH84_13200 [Alphaproteobacteria bacterium]|nr:hypothetical protein [Alphaproteobacteria bacterium]